MLPGRVVVDKTELTGSYRITLNFNMKAILTPPGAPWPSSDDAPSVFTAIQEQLGLKLQSARVVRDTLVIDHIERPTPNGIPPFARTVPTAITSRRPAWCGGLTGREVTCASERVSNSSAVFALFHPLRFGPLSQSIPAVVSLLYLARLWSAEDLYGVQQAAFVGWFITAMAVQLASHGPGMWIAGYVGQIALAIILVLKDQIDNTF